MKKKQDNCVRASALQVALALAFLSILVVLGASSFAQQSDLNAPAQSGGSIQALQTINTYAGMPVRLGPVTVNATEAILGPTDYPTLKDAFDAINAGTHEGDIIIDVVSSTTEVSTPATLNGSGTGAASYSSVLIRPVTDAVSISGNPAGGLGVVQLAGASNVTIDGDNPNTPGTNHDLTIQNRATNTTTYTSLVRIALATSGNNHTGDDTIENLNLVGNLTVTGTTDNALFALAAVPDVDSDTSLHIPTSTITSFARDATRTPQPRPTPVNRPTSAGGIATKPLASPAGVRKR